MARTNCLCRQGANIYLYHSYLFATRPAPAGTPIPTNYDGVKTFGFHQDSGNNTSILLLLISRSCADRLLAFAGVQRDIRGQHPWISNDNSYKTSPRMSLKCGKYLPLPVVSEPTFNKLRCDYSVLSYRLLEARHGQHLDRAWIHAHRSSRRRVIPSSQRRPCWVRTAARSSAGASAREFLHDL